MSKLTAFLAAAINLARDIDDDADRLMRSIFFGDHDESEESQDELDFLDDEDEIEDEPAISWPNVGRRPRAPEPVAPAISWPNVGSGGPATAVLERPAVSAQPSSLVADESEEEEDFVLRADVTVDARGRACVPAALTSTVRMRPGRRVYVARRNHNQPGVVLMRRKPGSGLLATYTVDKHGNVRLSAGLLRNAGLGGFTTIHFRTTDNNDGVVGVGG